MTALPEPWRGRFTRIADLQRTADGLMARTLRGETIPPAEEAAFVRERLALAEDVAHIDAASAAEIPELRARLAALEADAGE
ncbi:hypothetical protein ACF064_01595 [Streptomyces sp. NPDC015492]|uniref:hypothetical protein n=1 Tax=Streptomyces sp. NPDC015492 TaxID=3364958 RepID=UPI0036F81D36